MSNLDAVSDSGANSTLTRSSLISVAEALEHAGPWGQGFPEPLFDGEFDLQAPRVVANRHLQFVLRPDRSTHSVAGIAFNAVESG